MRSLVLPATIALAAPAAAQFQLDLAPSALRAQNQKDLRVRPDQPPRLVPGRATPVTPLTDPYGGSPYVSRGAKPMTSITTPGPGATRSDAYAAAPPPVTPPKPAIDPATGAFLSGTEAKPADPNAADPTRPRNAVQPGSLGFGVAPR